MWQISFGVSNMPVSVSCVQKVLPCENFFVNTVLSSSQNLVLCLNVEVLSDFDFEEVADVGFSPVET